jgi:hypothetical protein
MTDATDIAARLAAAGLRVKPLEWKTIAENAWFESDYGKNKYVIEWWTESSYLATLYGKGKLHEGTRPDCIAACERHHAETVLAMLEQIVSEEKLP